VIQDKASRTASPETPCGYDSLNPDTDGLPCAFFTQSTDHPRSSTEKKDDVWSELEKVFFFPGFFFCVFDKLLAALFFLSFFFFKETQPRLCCFLVGGLLGVWGGGVYVLRKGVTIWGGGGGSGSGLIGCAVCLFLVVLVLLGCL
jgi:hypothetical protein